MIKHIDTQLRIWAATYGGGAKAETGYRSYTVLYRFMLENGFALPSKTPSTGFEPNNEIAERMEYAVTRMPKGLKPVVCLRYLGNYPDHMAAFKMKLAVPTFRKYVDQAHYWIDGYLTLEGMQ